MGKCIAEAREKEKRREERERGMDEAHAESYDAAQLAVRVREIDRCREHTSTV